MYHYLFIDIITMKWIKMDEFAYDRSGDVILVAKDKSSKNGLRIIEDYLSSMIYEKGSWWSNDTANGIAYYQEIGDNKVKYWVFGKTAIKDVEAFIFKDDLLENYLEEIKEDE